METVNDLMQKVVKTEKEKILKKIDAEIIDIRRIGRELDLKESIENARLISQGMEYAKQIIQSGTDINVATKTKGDIIRESNESLARYTEAVVAVALGDSSFVDVARRIEYLNQPYTEEPNG